MKQMSPLTEKLLRRFYGSGRFKELPAWAADALHRDVIIEFGLIDRLKIAMGFNVKI